MYAARQGDGETVERLLKQRITAKRPRHAAPPPEDALIEDPHPIEDINDTLLGWAHLYRNWALKYALDQGLSIAEFSKNPSARQYILNRFQLEEPKELEEPQANPDETKPQKFYSPIEKITHKQAITFFIKQHVRANNAELLRDCLEQPAFRKQAWICYEALQLALAQDKPNPQILALLRSVPGVRGYEATPSVRTIFTLNMFYSLAQHGHILLLLGRLQGSVHFLAGIGIVAVISRLETPVHRYILSLPVHLYFWLAMPGQPAKAPGGEVPLEAAPETSKPLPPATWAADAKALGVKVGTGEVHYGATFIPGKKTIASWLYPLSFRRGVESVMQNTDPTAYKAERPQPY